MMEKYSLQKPIFATKLKHYITIENGSNVLVYGEPGQYLIQVNEDNFITIDEDVFKILFKPDKFL